MREEGGSISTVRVAWECPRNRVDSVAAEGGDWRAAAAAVVADEELSGPVLLPTLLALLLLVLRGWWRGGARGES